MFIQFLFLKSQKKEKMRVGIHFNSTDVHQTPTRVGELGTAEGGKEREGGTRLSGTGICPPELVEERVVEAN